MLSKPLGIFTTIPVEVALAAGYAPVDLNNRFITHRDRSGLVREAEELGLPRTLCAWIKGMYAWLLANPQVDEIVAVTQGDCSNTQALTELLEQGGRKVIPFNFPSGRDPDSLRAELDKLASTLGADLGAAEGCRQELLPLRRDLARLDQLTWETGQVSGAENHIWLVNASDFEGDPNFFHVRLAEFLTRAQERPPKEPRVRLGLLGVPPVWEDLHQVVEELGGAIVFNEVPRQFAMLPSPHRQGLLQQYLSYTYPYDIFARIEDITPEMEARGLHGLIHYTQTFCYRQMQDVLLRAKLKTPMLTLEGDKAFSVDARTRMRLEAFIDVLR